MGEIMIFYVGIRDAFFRWRKLDQYYRRKGCESGRKMTRWFRIHIISLLLFGIFMTLMGITQ